MVVRQFGRTMALATAHKSHNRVNEVLYKSVCFRFYNHVPFQKLVIIWSSLTCN
jgi:hypothetical protein